MDIWQSRDNIVELIKTKLPDVIIIKPRIFADDRGYFFESYNLNSLKQHGIRTIFVQDNHSLSKHAGTVRGLHYQSPPHAQDKLVRVSKGRIFDVAVDVRNGSPTFGQWVGAELSADNGEQLLVPAGFLHGFMTLEDNCEVQYKCSDIYTPNCDGAVRFDDPDIGIIWPISSKDAILSGKDEIATPFADFNSPFTFKDKS